MRKAPLFKSLEWNILQSARLFGQFCFLVGFFLGFQNVWAKGQKKSAKFQFEQILKTKGVIWSFEFLDESRIIFSTRVGNIFIANLVTSSVDKLESVPNSSAYGQGGLLDLAIDKKNNRKTKLFASYAKSVPGGYTTALAWAELKKNKLSKWTEIFSAQAISKKGVHFGSRIVFDDKNFLFLTVGDRGLRKQAQKLSGHFGKVLRLNKDGSVPLSNPFYSKKDALKEIWSYGHRNPQGLFFDEKTKQLYLNEHGPKGGDEINKVIKGKNYGWPEITYGKEYFGGFKIGEGTQRPDVVEPLKVYIPSIAPSTLLIYRGNRYKALKNHFLSGALKLRHINAVDISSPNKKELKIGLKLKERVRDIKLGLDSFLYFSTDSGKIFKIKNQQK